MAGIFKNLDASDIRLTPFRAYKQYEGTNSYVTYSAILNANVPDGQEDIGNSPYYSGEGVIFTTNDLSANTIWHSVNSQFYKYYYNNPKASFGQLNHTNQPRYLSDKALVISIPQRYSGEGIEPTTFAMTVDSTIYVDDLYGNIISSKGRWANGKISASNVVFALNPSTFTDQFGKTITYKQPSGGTLYLASVQLNNIRVTASQYETVLETNGNEGLTPLYPTSSIVIEPDGQDANHLFNFQNKDFAIVLSYEGTNECVLVQKKQQIEVPKVDFNGDVSIQKVYRYPYKISYTTNDKIRFEKSDGKTTLVSTTSWNFNTDYPLAVYRSGSTFTIKNSSNTHTFTDTLYDQERYCINQGNIHIGADENGENASSGRFGNVSFCQQTITNNTIFGGLNSTTEGGYNNIYQTVGNVFRQHGFIVITDKGLVSTIETNGISALEYRGTTTIYENEISCTVGAGEFGMTYNPSAHQYDPTMDQYRMADFATGSDFRPFVTRIGLYSDRSELVAIGTLSQPIQLPKNVDTTFIVRYDM